jgi:hypothetical protein
MVIYQPPVTGQHQINLQFEDLIQAGQIMFQRIVQIGTSIEYWV